MLKSLPDKLYHYTGIHGLKGIIESQTLWATHYKYLNDAEEIMHFRQQLPDILRPVFKVIFSALTKEQQDRLEKRYSSIAKAVEEESKKCAMAIYKVAFSGNPPFAVPYITSFCSVDETDKHVADHGLLSQWRGYGAQGGYAIIFDTAELKQLLKEEGEKWAYSTIFVGDVVYSSATDEEMHDEFGDHIDAIQKSWEQVLQTGDHGVLGKTYSPFFACACRYKHRGFGEEREFRIVTIPTPRQVVQIANAKGETLLPEKPVSHFSRNGAAVPYLNLFEDITVSARKRLPIKRIIVGPHPEKEKRKTSVESLLKQHEIQAEVSVSEIPYLA